MKEIEKVTQRMLAGPLGAFNPAQRVAVREFKRMHITQHHHIANGLLRLAAMVFCLLVIVAAPSVSWATDTPAPAPAPAAAAAGGVSRSALTQR